MNKPEVEDLLGSPEKTSYFAEYELAYPLGPEDRYISIDTDWLLISFDHTGVVDTAVIQSD